MNERLQLLRDWWTPGTTLRDALPIEATRKLRFLPLLVPPNDRVRLDDHEGVFPARPGAGQRYPEGAINRRELGLRSGLSVRCQLLAQSKLDDRLLVTASEERESAVKKSRRETE